MRAPWIQGFLAMALVAACPAASRLARLPAPMAAAQEAHALSYVNASPAGPSFPEWEGGDTELEFADINADGHADFVSIGDHGSPYVNTDEHGIMVYFGNGAGGWSIHMEGNFGYGGIAVGDVNNDGDLDVGYAMHHDYSGTDFGNQLIEVALGDGTGMAWTPWDDGLATHGEDWGMFATDFADIDGDGDLDLASNSFGASNGVHVYQNNGDGTWTQTWERSGGNARAHLCFGDVNGDGHPDIAASYQYGTIWLGDGEGGFVAADQGLPSAGTLGLQGVSLGDVDGDGCADLAFTQSGGLRVYLWGGSSWVGSSTGLPASGYEVARLWDMNRDGFVDVVAHGTGGVTVWLGDGTGHWTAGGGVNPGPSIDTAAFQVGGDIDHNGYPDAVFVQEEGSYPNYQNHLYVYRESTLPTARAAGFHFPRGNEAFFIGSVQTIRWWAEHVGTPPASIRLELSTSGPGGPWQLVDEGLPDGGHFQWSVPGPATDQACLRVTLSQAGEDISTVGRAFRILPPVSAGVEDGQVGQDAAAAARLHVQPSLVIDGGACTIVMSRVIGAAAGKIDGGAEVLIHEPSGRMVRALPLNGSDVTWDGRDERGRRADAGLYWITLLRSGEPRGAPQRVVVLR